MPKISKEDSKLMAQLLNVDEDSLRPVEISQIATEALGNMRVAFYHGLLSKSLEGKVKDADLLNILLKKAS